MKVLFVGTKNAEILAKQFRYYGINAHALAPPRWISNPSNYRNFNIIYGVYLMDFCSSFPVVKMLRKKYVIHVIGSDAFRYVNAYSGLEQIRKKLWDLILNQSEKIFFVTKELMKIMKWEKGEVIPIPVDTKMFKKHECSEKKRDILYYCPDPRIFQQKWIIDYAKKHPNEKITIIGRVGNISLPNIQVIPSVPYDKMPVLYNQHRRLIRMTTHDGYPKMPYEALLCGLEVLWNGEKITKLPPEMLMENTIPKLISILKEMVD
jgi:hypothetical protein